MLGFLPGSIKGALAVLLALLNTLFWFTPLLPLAILKFAVRVKPATRLFDRALNWVCTTWANGNKAIIDLLHDIDWEIEGDEGLSKEEWYLVVSNHQSWADILALQYALNDVIPYFRFFLKDQLKWFPILNVAWWALDYPYMTRYSKDYLEKNPHMKGRDLEITKKSCERFRDTPVAIMNFVEGTRFRDDKHERQGSPYKHLLKPRAGGVAFVMEALGDRISTLLDVTIAYPGGRREIWDFMCGRVPAVRMRIRRLDIGQELRGDYENDPAFKASFQEWVNSLWGEKDEILDELLDSAKT